jgi:hypothetical protein
MRKLLTGALTVVLSGSAAKAAVTYDLVASQTGTPNTLQSTFIPSTNGQVYSLNLYLRETVSNPDLSTLSDEGGLLRSNVVLTRTGTGASITAISRNAQFDDGGFGNVAVTGGGSGAELIEQRFVDDNLDRSAGVPRDQSNGTSVIVDSATVQRVFLGSFNVTINTLSATTGINIADFSADSGDVFTWLSLNTLDNDPPGGPGGIGSGFLVFTTLPEPTSLSLIALGGLVVARRRRA